ncbi:rhamnulokinase [Thermomonospora cellulosilytica]|uniref:Rhamnulokinase n=1 Tax=Thermomonospora cellulosilytica TaxID=1411118 RepID=A0A7W3R931_9ACTN|nr:rhamnulokinase family protein [Thermomonospora cellulosilytica]MBA9004918.1 rhamnulokinase [Thermomonospora cellulosilytica]
MNTFAAVDLGASSGRVMAARVGDGALELTEVRRFPNRPVRAAGTLHWNILGLYGEILDGLKAAGPGLTSIGIDSWAVDYGLLDRSGALLGNPVHYRDGRTDGVMERVRAELGDAYLYDVAGLQFLPFNTVYQLVAERDGLDRAHTLLMIPDLLAYWLTGRTGAELTNASTTGLLDVRTRTWSAALLERLGLPRRLLPELREPGEVIGPLRPDVATETGLPGDVPVTAVASHDTASAVAAVPARGEDFAYISCGTWSLVGVELPGPVLGEEGRTANFTNEAGIDGTVRYLRNVMGLWLLQESQRAWGLGPSDLPALLEAAAGVPAFQAVVDPDAPEFLPPGDMPARIAERCRATGQRPPATPPEVVRCIMDSLALGHRAAVREAARLSGRRVEVVHLVGGGSRNELLCRLTADACGLPVVAGPVEATALGNVLVQARAFGVVKDLAEMRGLVAATQPLRRYEPGGDPAAWDDAAARAGLR